MAHPIVPQPRTAGRSLLKSAVFGSVAAIAAPYVKGSYAAGSLALGVWIIGCRATTTHSRRSATNGELKTMSR